MFIRFVSNRSNKNNKKKSKKINFYKLASIGLAVFMLSSVAYRAWGYATCDGRIKEWLIDSAVALYKDITLKEYNIVSYGNGATTNETNVMSKLVETINGNSSLYQYMEENVLQVAFYENDPLYNYEDVVAKVEGVTVDGNEKNSQDLQQVADGNQVKDNANNTENSQENNEGTNDNKNKSDYVVPAVSEAGVTYTMEQLSDFDFLMSKLYTVPARALVYESDLVAFEMLKKDMTIKGDNSKPQILIYHTHSQEGFVDSIQGDDSTTIVAVGAYLAKILSEEYGYNVIHCQEHFDIAGGKLDRSKAYTYAQYTIEQILEDNPTIDVILDIHRDGLPEGVDKLVTNIGGKDTAKIMFFNGISRSSAAGDIDYLYNRYRADNLAFSFQLKLMAMECYPEFTRRNYVDAYQYNLHHRQKSVLVEVGAQNNTLQEELNAMEVLAEVLHRVISPQGKEIDNVSE